MTLKIHDPQPRPRRPWWWERGGRPSSATIDALADGLRIAARHYDTINEPGSAAELRKRADAIDPRAQEGKVMVIYIGEPTPNLLHQHWYRYPDDSPDLAGWAIMNVDLPPSAADARRGEVQLAWLTSAGAAEHIVSMHNDWLDQHEAAIRGSRP